MLTAARQYSLAVEILSPHRMLPAEQPGGLVVGYGAPSKPAFGEALEVLLSVLREVPVQAL